MKCAIWGAGRVGEWFKNAIEYSKAKDEFEIICFGDNSERLIGESKENLPVYALEQICEMYKKKEIESVIIATRNRFVKEISLQLSEAGITELYMLPEHIWGKKLYDIDWNRDLVKIDTAKPRLEYFEYHVADHCNLNCKGCGHMCPVVKEPSFGDYEQYVKDLKRLKELVWGVHRIRLMGGEPLLNNELPKFVRISREIFPDANISVVTNGLLIPKSAPELFKTMYENDCAFDITCYKPTEKLVPKIRMICDLYGVKCRISPLVEEFWKRRKPTGEEDVEKSFQNCMSNKCAFLKDGKIATCVVPFMINLYNNEFGLEMMVGNNDVVNLYDELLNGWELVEKLSSPIEVCRYCSSVPESYKWESIGSAYTMKDWVVE